MLKILLYPILFLVSSGVFAGQHIEVMLSDLKPTQAVIAYDQVANKIVKYQQKPNAFMKDLSETPRKTVVIGPGGDYYLTDGHHTFSAMLEFSPKGGQQTVTVEITDDKSSLNDTDFWQWMSNNHLFWPKDGLGNTLSPSQLPTRLGRDAMQDDALRGVMYWLRGHYLNKPANAIPYVEFYWAQYIREHSDLAVPPEPLTTFTRAQWISAIGQFIAHLPAQTIIGPVGQTAREMGQVSFPDLVIPVVDMPSFNQSGDTWQAVVEIPAGSTEKWQLNKQHTKWLEWELQDNAPRRIHYIGYPANYGAIPGTLAAKEDGGDGDPLDVLILGAPLPRGSQIPVRIIGRMNMQDDNQDDTKYLAILPDDDDFADIHSVTHLRQRYPGITQILQTWFSHYKGKTGNVQISGFDDSQPTAILHN